MIFTRLMVLCALAALPGAAAAASYSQADVNRDGQVSFQEARRVLPDLSEVHYRKFVNTPDGMVSKGAWPALDNFYQMVYRMR